MQLIKSGSYEILIKVSYVEPGGITAIDAKFKITIIECLTKEALI